MLLNMGGAFDAMALMSTSIFFSQRMDLASGSMVDLDGSSGHHRHLAIVSPAATVPVLTIINSCWVPPKL